MKKIIFISIILATIASGCSRFLEEKSDSKLTTPETLADNQAILDRGSTRAEHATGAEISADDFYITNADFEKTVKESEKRLHTWQPDRVSTATDNDWSRIFRRVVIFNTVLDNLKQYKIPNSDNVRGQALVYRASAYLEATQIFCLAYDKSSATSEFGLPLRLTSDFNPPSVRSTLEETYEQILLDLHTAVDLLPPSQVSFVRPSKVTALGFLSRAYLYMGNYEKSLQYGNEALMLHSDLLDYNDLDVTAAYPIPYESVEHLFPTSMNSSSYLLNKNRLKIHEDFYHSYNENDLRKSIFFTRNAVDEILFKGNYSGRSLRSPSLATDEIYLNVAESYAQLGDYNKAMDALNQLLVTRWKHGTYINFSANSKQEALEIIKTERRKELLIRGLRWADIKRYNRDGANITLTRHLNGETFTLPPNDYRFAIAIPEDIIKMTGMPQNKR